MVHPDYRPIYYMHPHSWIRHHQHGVFAGMHALSSGETLETACHRSVGRNGRRILTVRGVDSNASSFRFLGLFPLG